MVFSEKIGFCQRKQWAWQIYHLNCWFRKNIIQNIYIFWLPFHYLSPFLNGFFNIGHRKEPFWPWANLHITTHDQRVCGRWSGMYGISAMQCTPRAHYLFFRNHSSVWRDSADSGRWHLASMAFNERPLRAATARVEAWHGGEHGIPANHDWVQQG